MDTIMFIKKKIIFFFIILIMSVVFFSNVKDVYARENAYLSCLIDDESYMYKTQIIWSGEEIEQGRIGNFNGMELSVNNPDEFLEVYNYYCYFESEDSFANSNINNIVGTIDTDTGKISIEVDMGEGFVDGQTISSETWASLTTLNANDYTNPTNILTFPASNSSSARESDINRAYSISSTLGDDFRNALLFVNDGKSFTSVDALVDTAYALVSTNQGTITNQFGSQYRIIYQTVPSDEFGYCYECKITKIGSVSSTVDRSKSFIYMIKKGYQDCSTEDIFEDGTANNLNFNSSDSSLDTVYITWQQLFVEAGILYGQGISYANQADLYSIDSFENSLVKVFRNFISGIKNKLQLYSIEDCIFNNSIRGSQAFTYGVYKTDYSSGIFRFFMIMLALVVSMVVLAIIRVLIKKEWSTASPVARYSILEGIKDIVIVLFFLSSLWLLMKLVLVINFSFVDIWDAYIDGKHMTDSAGYSSLSALLYSFIFFVIQTYINIIYILRGLIVPVLMFLSPVFVFLFCWGESGKRLTGAWLKEFIGNVIIQSFHALIYGFILGNSTGLRGIEALVVCASIIPLTSVIKDISGVGGGQLLQKASNLSSNTVSAIGMGTSAVANTVGGAVSGVGSIASNTGHVVGKVAGNLAQAGGDVIRAGGGIMNTGFGVGNMIVHDRGQMNIASGMSQMSYGISGAIKSGSKAVSDISSSGGRMISNSVRSNSVNARLGESNLGTPNYINKNKDGTMTAHYNAVNKTDLSRIEALHGKESQEYRQANEIYALSSLADKLTPSETNSIAEKSGAFMSSSDKGLDITFNKPRKGNNYVPLSQSLGEKIYPPKM